jgi:hypothetical protein
MIKKVILPSSDNEPQNTQTRLEAQRENAPVHLLESGTSGDEPYELLLKPKNIVKNHKNVLIREMLHFAISAEAAC